MGGVILAWLSIIAAVSIIIYNPAAKIQKKTKPQKKLRKKTGFMMWSCRAAARHGPTAFMISTIVGMRRATSLRRTTAFTLFRR